MTDTTDRASTPLSMPCQLVHAADPRVTETIKRTNCPYFVLEGYICAICALLAAKDHVNVFLCDGTSGHSVKTSGTTGTTGASGQTAAAAEAPATARVGSAITLTGNDSGEKMAVTVTKVITSASPGGEFTSAPAGDRLYAVQFRLDDTGSAAYSDAPSNGAAVVDSSGQSYQASITDTASGCTSFPGTENIAPGASGLGCIVFEVPKAAKITGVQFTLDSGMGPQTGQWDVG